MNKYQKETIAYSLEEEKKVLRDLQKEYTEAKKIVKSNIKSLMNRTDVNLPSVIHQIEYQKALETQINQALTALKSGQYKTVADYLDESYKTGFTSSMYRLNKQGVPLAFPMDREEIIRAVQTNSKISSSLYKKLGINVKAMKNTIKQEVTRGISTSMNFSDIARNIDNRMNSGLYNSYRIARTEGHRINQEASFDAMQKAKDNGAKIVKKWDSTLDGRTRPHHATLDGQIKELDEPFVVDGLTAMYPSGFGKASEDINCRCCVLEIGKWELNEEDDSYTKWSDYEKNFVELSKNKTYQDYRKNYGKIVKSPKLPTTVKMDNWTEPATESNVRKIAKSWKIDYNRVKTLPHDLTENEIITKLAGADRTKGSCSSLAFSYIGEKNGLDVTDFRGGYSCDLFARNSNIRNIAKLDGVSSTITKSYTPIKDTLKQLASLPIDKEYYLAVGRHASIVKKTSDGAFHYLELQSSFKNGWMDLTDRKLKLRFASTKTSKYGEEIVLIDVDSMKNNDEFRAILGYINTETNMQKKGIGGGIK